MRLWILVVTFSLLVGSVPNTFVLAQEFDTTEPLTVTISPDYPRPYDTIAVTPQSTAFNLASSDVTISINGVVVESGKGGRSASITLGGPGSRSTIRVTAISGGVTYTKEEVLRPADVALVLEPITTTHPLYDGAALVAPESRVRVVALPDFRSTNGARISPNSLIYTWRLGNRILTEESGAGRSVLSATAPVRYRDADVSVTVTTNDESIVGRAATSVSPATPTVYAYRNDPLLGIDLSRALSGTFMMGTEEETFRAIPYNFVSAPGITWSLNGTAAGSEKNLTVRTTSSSAGSAAVNVNAAQGGGESARASFTINFNARRGTGIFGL